MATVETHDLLPVHSRVSWGAIFAGTVVALAINLLLSMLGVALGLSIIGQLGDRELGIGALVYVLVITQIALFVGGWVTSQCTVGENKMEAVVYGVLMWGTVFAVLMGLLAGGVRVGVNSVMGVMNSPLAAQAANLSDADLRAAGFTDEQVANFRSQFDRLRNDPQAVSQDLRTTAQDSRAVQAAWWSFGGMLLSMLVAVGGALCGSGPTFQFLGLNFRSFMMHETQTREPAHR